jgi:guanylate kinase
MEKHISNQSFLGLNFESQKSITYHKWLEWTLHAGTMYGTHFEAVENVLERGTPRSLLDLSF